MTLIGMFDKSHLRKTMLEKRQRLAPQDALGAAQAAASHVLSMVPEHVAVAGYCPVKGELDVMVAMKALSARGHALCLPVIEHREAPLVFYAWRPGEALIKGSYGIEVPAAGEVLAPAVVLVPLVAFDCRGHRLGYGVGYYDRTIDALRRMKKDIKAIGIAYSWQQVEAIPAEPQDERLDAIITEKGVIIPAV